MRPEKFTVAQVLAAIEKGHTGAAAARILGCAAQTVRNYADRYPTVRKALDGERDDIIDYAELGLRKAVLSGQPWAIAFALKTLGKKRGYVERQEWREVQDAEIDAEIERGLARLAAASESQNARPDTGANK